MRSGPVWCHTEVGRAGDRVGPGGENAAVLTKNIKGKSGNFDLVFTRNAEGRKALFHCRRYSYINLNAKTVKNKKVVK